MELTDLHRLLEDYFTAHRCEILKNQHGVLTVQLTEEMDKTLMNRPFYWHFVKSSGNQGEPMKLTLITNPVKRDEYGEWIHFGSPRLQQIFNHLKQKEKYIHLFQQIETVDNTALFPWLLINIKISYEGKQMKNELFSIGLNLINGEMKTDMMHSLQQLSLIKTIPDYCYTLSPLITVSSGFIRIEKVIDQYIEKQPHTWAEEAIQTMEEEIKMINRFFTDEEDEAFREKETKDLKKRYAPRIVYEVVNGGLIYLAEDFNKNI
ncbi:YqhG family protein [Virgibacillus sp. W0181]|uniref:YqhG family protein n=1 Tax=Virgibacillus sp. W0181 TaxID=3391581 RepID=UPI003F48C417